MIPEPNPDLTPAQAHQAPADPGVTDAPGHDPLTITIGPVLAAVTEFGCRRTVEVACPRPDLAIAIAGLHEARGEGQHTLIDSGLEPRDLVAAGVSDRVRRLDEPAEVALPALVAARAEFDCAVLGRGQAFDRAFRDFLYLDRLLGPDGLLVLDGAPHAVMAAVAEFIGQARAYERRSPRDSEVLILRKLGNQRTVPSVMPARWRSIGDLEPSPARVGDGPDGNGNPTGLDSSAANEHDATLDTAPTRELHLARARMRDMESRVADLGTRLIDAEQRAADLLRTRLALEQAELARQESEAQVTELHQRLQAAAVARHPAGRRNPFRTLGRGVRGAGRRLRGHLGH